MIRDARTDPRLAAILSEVAAHQEGPRRMFLLEQAINIADTLGDLQAGWDLRIRLMSDAEMSGYCDRTVVALSWCLAMADRRPDTFDVDEVLWQLKWVASTAVCMSAVPRDAVIGVMNEMETRFMKAGWGMRAVHHKRMNLFWSLGDIEQVPKHLELWQSVPRDRGSDCLACERDQMIEIRILLGQGERAIREAKPLIENRQGCSHVPQRTYNKLVFPLWKLGRFKEAMEMQRRGVKATKNGLEYLWPSANHMLFAACTDQHEQAAEILARRLPDCDKAPDELSRLEFYQHAVASIRAMRTLGHETAEALAAVRAGQMPEPTPRLDLWEAHLTARAGELAERFDRRGGNTYRARCMAELLATAAMAPEMAGRAQSMASDQP